MSGHTHTHTHTHVHTYTHDNYYNPRCAHAHRGLIIMSVYSVLYSGMKPDNHMCMDEDRCGCTVMIM